MIKRDDATQRQVRAARPGFSTWLSANAGSGKTRVLTDRVARLLIENVEPQNILCLTYTKAAASEMQNRLFDRLGKWAMLDDTKLRDELDRLGVTDKNDNNALRDARTLFARAIETPGGLKIQTIHSFCAALLRRFPLESGVSPNFVEMDDRSGVLLRAEVVEKLAEDHACVVADVAKYIADENFEKLSLQIVRRRPFFNAKHTESDIWAIFGLSVGFDETALSKNLFLGNEAALTDSLVSALKQGSIRDLQAAKRLGSIAKLDVTALPILESIFLTGGTAKIPFSAKVGSFPTKPTQELLPQCLGQIEDWMRRVETARQGRLALAAARKTRALYRFADLFLPAYETAKQLRGWLDFDDLIQKSLDLLNNNAVAAWVLYRLDGGIDHILVDEAQDTSPTQWGVIEKLAQEFTSGSGARADIHRTIFVVGDKKQSIYSFQGADPREFDRMQAEFSDRLEHTPAPLQKLELQHSFRSASAILEMVDLTFADYAKSGFSPDQTHQAFKADLPGRVDLWPTIPKSKPEEKNLWYDSVDRVGENHHTVLLACRVAAEIDRMITEKVSIPAENSNSDLIKRPVQAGDFLILVQSRGPVFHEIIRECKQRNLPIAGSDRLKVGAEMAVKDLVALLSFLATPEDNLSLAVALKSPLFGWNEQDLFDLAHKRDQDFLWQALRARSADYHGTLETLFDLRNHVDFLRPYDLLERILTRHNGRRNLLSRLGTEAEDGIDALLSQALVFERNSIPSLTGFVQWMATSDIEIKRQMGSSGNQIRVMTVHGSKGLESPIVILPDTANPAIQIKDELLTHDGHVLWKTKADETPEAIQNAKDCFVETQTAERDRLLYVAMTRAEKWLIVAAAGDLGKKGNSWYDRTNAALVAAGAHEQAFGFGSGLRFSNGSWEGLVLETDQIAEKTAVDLPAFFHLPASKPASKDPVLSPSNLGGPKALAGELGLDEDAAMRRGRHIHQLLENLPSMAEPEWKSYAKTLLETGNEPASSKELLDALAEARTVLTSPHLLHLFQSDALVEVPLSANIKELGNRRIHGIVDRVVISKDRVLIIDFKTNAHVPNAPDQCPDGLLRQMGVYGSAFAQIYPDHIIETAILWTKTASLMILPHDLVYHALCDTQIP